MVTDTGLLPLRSRPVPEADSEPMHISGREADTVIDILSCQTTRAILAALDEDPQPISIVAEEIGTSTQNAAYHIKKLHEASLVEVIDTWYSPKGREMDIYAATCDTLVLSFGASASEPTLPDSEKA